MTIAFFYGIKQHKDLSRWHLGGVDDLERFPD
jgi:hypothetical protein